MKLKELISELVGLATDHPELDDEEVEVFNGEFYEVISVSSAEADADHKAIAVIEVKET